MAKIKVVGSSSAGNGYVIDTGDAILLLECGVKARSLLRAASYRINKIAGCLISHIHGDHCSCAKDIAQAGIDIYSNDETIAALHLPRMTKTNTFDSIGKWVNVGEFKVMPFECKHDVKNFGYIIKHHSFGTILFGTDTYAYPVLFKGVDHYLIEANYSDELLSASSIDQKQKERLLTSHMSLNYCIRYLQDCDAGNRAKTITLIHLSDRHSNADEFQAAVQRATGVPTYIADAGVEIDITDYTNN